MMTNFFLKLFIVFLLNFYTTSSVIATPTSLRGISSLLNQPKSFNVVTDFGASNDGTSDTTQSFRNAWNAACAWSNPSQIYVPKGTYLLKSISFTGPCKSNMFLRIDGTILAHDLKNNDDFWISFQYIDGLHIKGGVLDAKGQDIWKCKLSNNGGRCPNGAKSMEFFMSKNIIVTDLTSQNSQMFHMTVNACQNIYMRDMRIIADADSPNTDGIHLANSEGFTIVHSTIATGDDCISMGPNNQNFWISNINCGPGHGISIGSLGRVDDKGVTLRNITVKSSTFTESDNGLRIKTFSTDTPGIVEDIYFLGATMNNVRNPIIIDQNYCPHGECPSGQGSGIQIKNVYYKSIHGTSSSKEVVTLDCSPRRPCTGITLDDVQISYNSDAPICEINNAKWRVIGSSTLPSNCLT